MPGRLEGSVAVVTGAGSGIGAGILRRFVHEGATVIGMDRDTERLRQIVDPLGDNAIAVTGDVTNPDDCRRAVTAALDRYGKLDTLVANAGVHDQGASLTDFSAAELDHTYEEVFAVNVKGALLIVHAALDELIRAHGSIIFTGSISSLAPGFGGALYVSSKHAVLGLARQLALSLAGRVRVNTVAPGYVHTNLTGLPAADQVIHRLPTGKVAEPEDIAGVYAMLASASDGSAITGSVFSVDSGQLLTGPGLTPPTREEPPR